MQYNITFRQKDGGWQFIVSYKKDNVWKQKSKQGFKTKKLAQQAVDETITILKQDLENIANTNQEYSSITFGEFAKMYVKHITIHKEFNTVDSYRKALLKFNNINNLPMTEIKFEHIQKCVDDMVSSGIKSSTIKSYYMKIKLILEKAITPYNIIVNNPAKNVVILTSNKEDKKINALTKEEIEKLITFSKSSDIIYQMIITVILTTGLRFGELEGLTWDNIDFKQELMTINKQWKLLKTGEYGLGTVKSKNSNRTIPLPKSTATILLNYKNNTPLNFDNRVLPTIKTKHKTLRDVILKFIQRKAKLNHTVHDLRHTYATNLIASGVDFRTVAQLMGHTVEMTMKTYSHFTPDMMDKAKKAINNIF